MLKVILVAIISGFFSLAGIWYQNYLSRRTNARAGNAPVGSRQLSGPAENAPPEQNKRLAARFFFTILVAILPGVLWKLLVEGFRPLIYKYMPLYAKIMVSYFSIWLVVTLIALGSGWTYKTVYEKIILFISAGFLIYWDIWMIIVHRLWF